MKTRILWLFLATITALSGACNDTGDAVQKNPHFSAGGKSTTSGAGSAAGGADGVGLGGGTDASPLGGALASEGGTATLIAGETSTLGGAGEAGAPNGGAPEPQPAYDCVLHPKTHLEIINACTAATRVEKHPVLPPIN